MTFHDRAETQEAIERVYHSPLWGVTRSFEDAVARELLDMKVHEHILKSAALERFWKSPITAGMLRAEMERMGRETRMPDRLSELYETLGDDPLVIQECLARQILADRRARGLFAMDRTVRADARHAAERLRDAPASGRIDSHAAHPARTIDESPAEEPGRTRTATCSVTKRTWDDWWREVEAGLDPASVEPVALLEEGLAVEPSPISTGLRVRHR